MNDLTTTEFEQRQRQATALARWSSLPKCLKGKDEAQTVANVLAVYDVAERWGMSAYAVAGETYEVEGKISYQGKLIHAVLISIGGVRLSFHFEGKGDDRKVTATGTIPGEDNPRDVWMTVRQGKTNNPMWKSDPDQKLVYNVAIKWARRHMPELVLGVSTSEEIEQGGNSAHVEITQQQNYQRPEAEKRVRDVTAEILAEQTPQPSETTQLMTDDGQLFDTSGMPANVED